MNKKQLFLSGCLALALSPGLLLFTKWLSISQGDVKLKYAPNNPQDFFLSGSNSGSFSYYFRYDPRAADEWLFHSGGAFFASHADEAGQKRR